MFRNAQCAGSARDQANDLRPSLKVVGHVLAAVWAMVATAQASDVDTLIIDARPISQFDRANPDNRFGSLTFLGGLNLTSANRDFRALSGLSMQGDLMSLVTDEGYWVTARLESDTDGRPLAIGPAHIGPLLDHRGEPMVSKQLADAEAITQIGDEFWVSSERNQPIRAYTQTDGRPTGAARLPFGDSAPLRERWNHGIEAMVHVTEGPLAGETLVFLEQPPLNAAGPTAARLTASGAWQRFAVQRVDGFAITGAAVLPGGDVLIVERRFSWRQGLFMRLRRLPADEIITGAVQGRLLLEADGATMIDNMEGVAVTDHPNGPIVTLISDDNGSFLQSTLVLRFQITGGLEGVATATPPAPLAHPTQQQE